VFDVRIGSQKTEDGRLKFPSSVFSLLMAAYYVAHISEWVLGSSPRMTERGWQAHEYKEAEGLSGSEALAPVEPGAAGIA